MNNLVEIKRIPVGLAEANCYLLSYGDEMIVIDPGAEPKKILDEIKKTGIQPEYIINTHHHIDHVGANGEIKKETGAKVLIHNQEREFISFKADWFLKDGDIIKVKDFVLEVIHTPGHTPGSICLLGKDFIFTGDTIFRDGYGRTDLKGGSWQKLDQSLKKLKRVLRPGMKVYPGHGVSFRVKVYT